VGVPYYIIVDDAKRKEKQPPTLIVYQLETRGQYNQLTPDERGWYWIDIVDLWIGPYQDWVSWYAADGTKIGTHLEVDEARKLAEEQRKLAEEQAHAEAHARKLAEEQAHTEAHARKLAEEQARTEAHARQLAEDRIRELEAMLRAAGLG
jgi:cell division protein FtsB